MPERTPSPEQPEHEEARRLMGEVIVHLEDYDGDYENAEKLGRVLALLSKAEQELASAERRWELELDARAKAEQERDDLRSKRLNAYGAWEDSEARVLELEAQLKMPHMNRIEAALLGHYLVGIECDHDGGRDRPVCSCSLIELGWHPSVDDAVRAWADHVLAVVRGRWSMDAALRNARALSADTQRGS